MTERVVGSGLSHVGAQRPRCCAGQQRFGTHTALAMRPHPDDADQRNVVLVWSGVEYASLGAPNDEAISGHRLWRAGLSDVLWLGLVEGSDLIAELKEQDSVHPTHDPRQHDLVDHYIAPLKECVVEVVARSVEIYRQDGRTLEAAVAVICS